MKLFTKIHLEVADMMPIKNPRPPSGGEYEAKCRQESREERGIIARYYAALRKIPAAGHADRFKVARMLHRVGFVTSGPAAARKLQMLREAGHEV